VKPSADCERALQRRVLSPALLRELAEDNPFGFRLIPEEVAAWWEFTWPRFKTYEYRQPIRAIRQWWARARPQELARARLLIRNRDRDALREQEEAAVCEDADLRAVSGDAAAAIFGRR